MKEQNILYKSFVNINDKIQIVIPTVEQVLDNEADYYGLVSALTAMPIDMMVQLDDAGIDFTTIDEFQLFQLMFMSIQKMDVSLIFGDLDISNFELVVNPVNQELMFYDEESEIAIDKAIYEDIANTLRKINHLEKNLRKPGNEEAKDYLIDRERRKQRRRKNKPQTSQLEPLVLALVNTQEFKYDFEGVRNLTIYQFNSSVRQVIKRIEYGNRMFGVYSGSIDVKSINKDDLTWISQ